MIEEQHDNPDDMHLVDMISLAFSSSAGFAQHSRSSPARTQNGEGERERGR